METLSLERALVEGGAELEPLYGGHVSLGDVFLSIEGGKELSARVRVIKVLDIYK